MITTPVAAKAQPILEILLTITPFWVVLLVFIQALTVISPRLSAKFPPSMYELNPLKVSAPPILPCVGDVEVDRLMSCPVWLLPERSAVFPVVQFVTLPSSGQ